jgi:hypothetical protein
MYPEAAAGSTSLWDHPRKERPNRTLILIDFSLKKVVFVRSDLRLGGFHSNFVACFASLLPGIL